MGRLFGGRTQPQKGTLTGIRPNSLSFKPWKYGLIQNFKKKKHSFAFSDLL